MSLNRNSGHIIRLCTFAVAMFLSATTVLLIDTRPAKAADEFFFSGNIEATIPTIDGKTQYGPVLITLTDITSQTAKDISLQKVTPPVPLPGYDYSIAIIQFTNISINKNNTYQICIKATDLCTHKIGPSEQMYNSYVVKDKGVVIGIHDIISVSKQYIIENPSVIPVTSAAAAATPTKTCGDVVTGVGWILCPVVTGITALNDSMWSLVSGLLNVNPISQSSSIYTAWTSIRDIANVVFVIIFLIMTFSQVSNIGITNYGIKKLLPRLILGAILVNISFVIVQIIVDLANIIGASLYNLLAGLAPDDFLAKAWASLPGMILSAVSGAGLLVGGVALVGGAAAAFWMLAPVALMGLLALLAAILTLIFRQAVIPILAILAPLAFVAYLLPNTESWFKKWRSMLTQMLMLYPLAAVVFGGSQLAARLIIGESPDWWNTIMGVIIMTLPLFSLPYLATKGGAIVSTVGGALNSIVNKAKAPISKATGAYADRARVQTDNQAMNRVGGFSPRRSYLQYRARTEAIGQNQQRELTRGQTSYVANRAESNPAFRATLAAGGGQGADMRALSSAINTQEKLALDEDATAKSVFEHANFSGEDRQKLAIDGIVMKNGVEYSGTIMQRAAIGEQMRTGSIPEIHAIIDESGGKLAKFSQTIGLGIAKNGLGAKDPALSGKRINAISQGDIKSDADFDKSILEAINDGKYTSETLATMDNVARERVIRVAKAANPIYLQTLKDAAKGINRSIELKSKIQGNTKAFKQINVDLA